MSIRHGGLLAVVTLALLVGTACGGDSQEAVVQEGQVDVVAVAGVATKLRERPDEVDAILQEASLTRQAFEDALFQIAEDPDLSQKYASLVR